MNVPQARRLISRLFLVAILVALAGEVAAAPSRPAKPDRATRDKIHQIGLRKAAVNQKFLSKHCTQYEQTLPSTPIGDQQHSGRCWAFAWTKTLQSLAKARGSESGVLSAAFINFHALKALAHGAIDEGLRTADRPKNNLYRLEPEMVGEGGYSHWANAIVKKHGIVPEERMPSSTFDSRESDLLQNHIHRIVAAAYRDLGRTSERSYQKRRAIATEYKKKVDEALETLIGTPPRRFTVNGKTYTPKTYLRDYLKLADEDLQFVNLTSDPERAWNKRYRESYVGKGIPGNESYNVSMDVIQEAARRTLRDGIAVNVAVNVDWDNPHRVANRVDKSSKTNGVLSLAAFNYEKVIPTGKLSRRDRLYHNVSLSNHMMAITGYQRAKRGEQARWLIDNSHGTDNFRDGRFDMYDDFFKNYVEEVTVPRSALPASLLKKLENGRALDTIDGMNIPPSKGGDRWTPTHRRMLVKALIREELSFDEAAQRYKLPVETVRRWYNQAKKAMLQEFREHR